MELGLGKRAQREKKIWDTWIMSKTSLQLIIALIFYPSLPDTVGHPKGLLDLKKYSITVG